MNVFYEQYYFLLNRLFYIHAFVIMPVELIQIQKGGCLIKETYVLFNENSTVLKSFQGLRLAYFMCRKED